MSSGAWSWKTVFGEAAKRAVSNALDIVTSKTTWVTVGGAVFDAAQHGGKLSPMGLALLGAKALQQAFADFGKNAKK